MLCMHWYRAIRIIENPPYQRYSKASGQAPHYNTFPPVHCISFTALLQLATHLHLSCSCSLPFPPCYFFLALSPITFPHPFMSLSLLQPRYNYVPSCCTNCQPSPLLTKEVWRYSRKALLFAGRTCIFCKFCKVASIHEICFQQKLCRRHVICILLQFVRPVLKWRCTSTVLRKLPVHSQIQMVLSQTVCCQKISSAIMECRGWLSKTQGRTVVP